MPRRISEWWVVAVAFCVLVFLCGAAWAAIDFDGLDDVLDCGSASSLDDISPLTYSTWVNIDTSGEGSFGRFFDKTTIRFLINQNSANQLTFGHVTTGTALDRSTTANPVAFDSWHHVLFTWNGGLLWSGVHIYIDGTEALYAGGTDGTGSLSSDAADNLLLGNRAAGDRTFDGMFADTAMWAAVLSADEISRLALSRRTQIPLQIRPADLRLYVSITEFSDGVTASGTGAIRDRSGNGNHCTPTNSPVGRAQPLGIQGVAWLRSPITVPWALAARVVW